MSPCTTQGPCLSQAATGVLPAVNQLEFHPWVGASTHETVQWCTRNGARETEPAITLEATGPTLARMHRCHVPACAQRGPLLPTAGIAIIAYGSLGSSSNKASVGSGVAQVAARHGVSSAALLLRWALARGAAVIPGATSAAHIRENLAARRLRFELSPEDEAIIAGDAKPPGWKLWPNMGKG